MQFMVTDYLKPFNVYPAFQMKDKIQNADAAVDLEILLSYLFL